MIKIYGKDECPFCVYAQEHLKQNGIEYVYENIHSPEQVRLLKEQYDGIQTVPVVVVDNQWIGGYNELVEYTKNNFVKVDGEVKNVIKG